MLALQELPFHHSHMSFSLLGVDGLSNPKSSFGISSFGAASTGFF
jgi:hypothetical protein